MLKYGFPLKSKDPLNGTSLPHNSITHSNVTTSPSMILKETPRPPKPPSTKEKILPQIQNIDYTLRHIRPPCESGNPTNS
jgi:hypothetical protein